ncbi:MAG: hypothetical protein NC041_05875 [Bacteroides sp.]|nr:hypothetical protein [Prevotella sp.]MCM1407484.1 hypothetical protein [Treponema brennaborense]MCM1469974.1 hypothetical protein [Bacteroides sp.]
MSTLAELMKNYLDKSVEISKEALAKANASIEDFGGKSVARIEIKQLESKMQKQLAVLGLAVYDAFEKDSGAQISLSDAKFAEIIGGITECRAEIEKRQDSLK